jgi:DNA-binding protein YbaB
MENVAELIKQAEAMQVKMAEMQARVKEMEVEGSDPAGMVRVVLAGSGALKRVFINPVMANPPAVPQLQAALVAADKCARDILAERLAGEMDHVMETTILS